MTYTASINVLKVFFQRLKNKSRGIGNTFSQSLSQSDNMSTQKYQPQISIDLTQEYEPESTIECKSCSNLINIEKMTELQLIDKPFLFNFLNSIKDSKELIVLQVKNNFKLSGMFSSFIPDTLTKIEKIEKEFDFNKFKLILKTPELNPGKPFHTGFIDSDGVNYELLFCMKCSNLIGVKIVAGNMENIKYIGDYWIFKDLVEFKMKSKLSEDHDESPVEKKRKIEEID